MERSEVVVPARVIVVLLVALLDPLERTLGLFASLIGTEPVGDFGVVVVRYHPPSGYASRSVSTVLLRRLSLKPVSNHMSSAELMLLATTFSDRKIAR